MGKLSLGETKALSNDFYLFMKEKSLLGQTFDRQALKTEYYAEFREHRVAKSLSITNLANIQYCLKATGLLKRKGTNITLLSDVERLPPKANIVVDAMAVEKRRRPKKTRAREVQKQLIDCVSKKKDGSTTSAKDDGIQISCMPPSVVSGSKGDIEFCLDVTSSGDSKMKIMVKNNSGKRIFLLRCQVMSKQKEFSLSEIIEPKNKKSIKAGQEFTLVLTCLNNWVNVGASTTELMFQYSFDGSQLDDFSTVVYYIRFGKMNDLVKKLLPQEPYVKPPAVAQIRSTEIIPGIRPPSLMNNKLEVKLKLPECPVPAKVKDALQDGAFVDDADSSGYKKIREVLESPVNKRNYAEKFHWLLHLEEIQQVVAIRRYDMSSVKMKKQGRLFYLKVPGLAEKRPSVLRGDKIYVMVVREDGSVSGKEYEGYVHHVELNRVGLGFSNSLLSLHNRKTKYNVRFTFNRYPMKLAHRAIGMNLPSQLLFPQKCNARYSDIKIRTKDFLNPDIQANPEQMAAVNNVVRGKNFSVPYIVFGPPGTGKTLTVVEAIHQIIRLYEGCHLLVCAPSNSACDHLTGLLLANIREETIIRMHASSRAWRDVPRDIRHVSNYDEDECEFYFPPKDELSEYEIIVCTLITAGRLASAKFPDDHFTHIFIDEAGQATEPECMVAIGGNLAIGGQVVLAGDPKQLGPVVMSAAAKKYGLGLSYIERLMETEPLYQKDETLSYNPDHITKLLNNYRSHQAILKVPNRCFYENELRFTADITKVKALCDWSFLPQRGFPVVFEGVSGEDLRESTSPSFYNPQEISVLIEYVEKLLENGIHGKNIGIIAPYRKQVEKLKQLIKNIHIKIGSVEEFQGQEKEVIIISTVRSDSKHLSFDAKYNLGFLTDPKRFNVAVTRAKALLIVIGNPHVLVLDYYWKALLEHCVEKNAYRGIEYEKEAKREVDVDEVDELLNRFVEIEIDDSLE